MGGIVIDIGEKSNFFGSIGSQKGAKNAIFLQGGSSGIHSTPIYSVKDLIT